MPFKEAEHRIEGTYDLNCAAHQITGDRHSFLLTKSGNTSDRLALDTRVPLRLENVDMVCSSEIEPANES